jgi:hypothetical protein
MESWQLIIFWAAQEQTMANVSDLAQSLLAPFAAGFVVQRVLEITDPWVTARIINPNTKRSVMGVISFGFGMALAHYADITVFHALGVCMTVGWDHFFSAIFISAGTEGFNSLMKFANYKKEASKADAADKISKLTASQLGIVNPRS